MMRLAPPPADVDSPEFRLDSFAMSIAKVRPKVRGGTTKPVVTRQSLRTQLENDIIEGRLQPGERLDEKELAARFGVSRTPIREVLLQLSSLGLITLRPRRSALVRRMSGRQVIAMWEVLTGLEGLCARLAARRISVEGRERLKELCDKSREAVEAKNIEAYDGLNKEFHEALYTGAHNVYLAQRCREIRRRVNVYRRYGLKQPGRLQTSFQEHLLIAEAVMSGQDAHADELMQSHLSSGGHVFSDLLALIPETADSHD
jgi:DNA-binding GntR family transcriptional regulator